MRRPKEYKPIQPQEPKEEPKQVIQTRPFRLKDLPRPQKLTNIPKRGR